jgi:hypothetical protein
MGQAGTDFFFYYMGRAWYKNFKIIFKTESSKTEQRRVIRLVIRI